MQALISELSYLGLEVSNLERWGAFATEVLGFEVKTGPHSATQWLRMDERPYRFILTEGPADDFSFAGWRAYTSASLDTFAARLRDRNIEFGWATEHELQLRAVDRMLHFRDPIGARHEVFTDQTPNDGEFQSTHFPSGFVTGGGGLGHVVFGTSDYAAELAFVKEVIGLRVSDFIQEQPTPNLTIDFAFLNLNSRHHSFALASVGGAKLMHHFLVETKTVEEVGLARDRCLAMGQQVPMDIGQHPNDRMISFYGQTPSGFLVEVGCGAALAVVEDGSEKKTYSKISSWGHRPALPPKSHQPEPQA